MISVYEETLDQRFLKNTLAEGEHMKADKIIKNAKIFTSDKDKPEATALVVKDGKFAYVGDEAGLSEYEGEVTDLGGKFIMPGIIDSHVHVALGAAYEGTNFGEFILTANSKKEALDYMVDFMKKNPGLSRYRFVFDKKYLHDCTSQEK